MVGLLPVTLARWCYDYTMSIVPWSFFPYRRLGYVSPMGPVFLRDILCAVGGIFVIMEECPCNPASLHLPLRPIFWYGIGHYWSLLCLKLAASQIFEGSQIDASSRVSCANYGSRTTAWSRLYIGLVPKVPPSSVETFSSCPPGTEMGPGFQALVARLQLMRAAFN